MLKILREIRLSPQYFLGMCVVLGLKSTPNTQFFFFLEIPGFVYLFCRDRDIKDRLCGGAE